MVAALFESENSAPGGATGANPLADFKANRAKILKTARRNTMVFRLAFAAVAVLEEEALLEFILRRMCLVYGFMAPPPTRHSKIPLRIRHPSLRSDERKVNLILNSIH